LLYAVVYVKPEVNGVNYDMVLNKSLADGYVRTYFYNIYILS